MNNYTIWLDDLRDPLDYGLDYSQIVHWDKSFSEFKSRIQDFHKSLVDAIHLDHDLGLEEDGTGYDALLLIEEMLYNEELPLLKVLYIHTSNPSAARKMMSVKDVFRDKFGVKVLRNNY